jgi:large subunit ribosomal protein L13
LIGQRQDAVQPPPRQAQIKTETNRGPPEPGIVSVIGGKIMAWSSPPAGFCPPARLAPRGFAEVVSRSRHRFKLKWLVDFIRASDRLRVPFVRVRMKTHLPKVNLDQRKWHLIDADGAVLGRLAAQVTDILRGKNKPVYTPHLDAGDFVVVINAEKVRLTGKKETAKEYMTYSGWKGGEKYRTVAEVRARHPEELIHRAVKGMMPKNRLGRVLLTKLKVFKGPKHPHAAQKPGPLKAAA